MSSKKIVVELTLTKDELTVLKYLIAQAEHEGDPLKDTYELGDEEPGDPYKAMGTLIKKVAKLKWAD